MEKNSNLSESLEDYLEIILALENKNKVARAKDIADKMGVKRGSVTSALKNLSDRGLINYEPYSFVTLTTEGSSLAKNVVYRHTAIKKFLVNVLQIDEATAESTACRMEHTVDKLTLERMVSFFDFIFSCPRAGEDWIQSFMNSCVSDKSRNGEKCRACVDNCLK